MKLTLETYKIPSWNILYAGKHWTTREEMKKDAGYAVLAALTRGRYTMFTGKVKITVTGYFKSRLLDADNLCEKLIIDFVKGKIKKDDTPEYVESVTTKSVKADRDYTEIVIETV